MSQVEQLLSEAMKLSGAERTELTERLLQIVSDDDPELVAEFEASIDDEEAGRLVDANVVMARLGSRA